MQEYLSQKLDAWAEHGRKFKCEHLSVSLRTREIQGGSVQFVYQCMRCGDAKGQAIRRVDALRLCEGNLPPPFEPVLQERWAAAKSTAAEAINAKFGRGAFFEAYDEHLKTDAWRRMRSLVFRRAQGLCEGCGQTAPTQVHHLTYEHLGQEFLFELVAVCDSCHERVHEPPTAP